MKLLPAVLVAATIFFCSGAGASPEIVGGDIPPKQYDHSYSGRMEIVELSSQYVAATDGPDTMGFTYGSQSGKCVIYINRAWLKYKRSIIRHERGHCNGWPADHQPPGHS